MSAEAPRGGGLLRLVGSSKAWVALATAIGATLAALNVPSDRVTAIVTAITSIGVVVVLAIAGEDAARNLGGGAEG